MFIFHFQELVNIVSALRCYFVDLQPKGAMMEEAISRVSAINVNIFRNAHGVAGRERFGLLRIIYLLVTVG